MRHWPRNFPAACMRSRSTRRRRGKVDLRFTLPLQGWVRKSERGPCPPRLGFLHLRIARHRGNTERGDAVALAAQHTEAEAVEGKTLAAIGDRARLVDDEARDRRRLFVRQAPVHGAVEIADRDR